MEPGVIARASAGSLWMVVVEDEVHVEIARHLLVDLDQDLLELTRPLALLHRPDDPACCHVERGEQAGGAVADEVTGSPLGGSLTFPPLAGHAVMQLAVG